MINFKLPPKSVCTLRGHKFEYTWHKPLNPSATIRSAYYSLGYRMTTCTRCGHVEHASSRESQELPHYIPGDTTHV